MNEKRSPNEWIGGLTKRVLWASSWAIANNAVRQALRLGSNLVLSRLLFPSAFGTMAIVASVLAGLEMLSDVGVGPSIIRDPQHSPRFLDTLWSVQIVRGWGQWIVSLLISYPIARWYDDPTLFYLVSAMGLTSIVRGYAHTSQFTLSQQLRQRELFLLDVISYCANISTAMIAAYASRSVWALVFGAYAGSLTRCALSYWMAAGQRRRWCWDRAVLEKVGGFSRWVFVSTLLTFVSNQGNSLILGSFASLTFLGLYSIASGVAGIISQVIVLLSGAILFPLYGNIGRETTPELRRRIVRIRMAIMSLTLPPLWTLICFGDWFIRLLWDPRYLEAGSMVQILSGGSLFMTLGIGPLYLARGEAWIGVVFGGAQVATLLPALALGGHFFGSFGLVCGTAISQVARYPLEVWAQRRYAVWVPWLDAVAFVSSATVIALGFLLRFWLGF